MLQRKDLAIQKSFLSDSGDALKKITQNWSCQTGVECIMKDWPQNVRLWVKTDLRPFAESTPPAGLLSWIRSRAESS